MPVVLFRIDDRLIHGQVIVGWGQPLSLGFIVLVDDEIAESDWEQELYRMGVPPDMSVSFLSVDEASEALPSFQADPRKGIVLTGDVDTMARLVAATNGNIRRVNLGGIHHADGRTPRLRYVFLSPAEERRLRTMEQAGVEILARDVPSAEPVPLSELLSGGGDGTGAG